MLFLLIHGFLSPNVSSEKESLEDFITKVDYPNLEYSLQETYQEGNGSYLPIEFVPNRGQLSDKDVKFQVNDRNGAVFFKPGELHLAIYDQPRDLTLCIGYLLKLANRTTRTSTGKWLPKDMEGPLKAVIASSQCSPNQKII